MGGIEVGAAVVGVAKTGGAAIGIQTNHADRTVALREEAGAIQPFIAIAAAAEWGGGGL